MNTLILKETDVDRFVSKVQFPAAGPDDTKSCWFWRGAKHSKTRGYGKFRIGARIFNAHKAAYLLFRGEVANGLVVAHQCNCETCVNPWHLEAQTQVENMQYCVQSGRHNSQQVTV